MQQNPNPYDFLNSSPAPKRSFSPTTQKGRIIRTAIAASILLISFGLVFGLLFSKDTGPKTPLLELSAAQSDLIALAKQGSEGTRDSALKAQSQEITLTVTTQNQGTNALLASYGVKKPEKELKKLRDTSFAAKLKAASENNTFDETYRTILSDRLGVYRAKLNNAYNAVSATSQKKQLSGYYLQIEQISPTAKT